MARIELFGLPGAGKTTLARQMPGHVLSGRIPEKPAGYRALYDLGADLIETRAPGTNPKIIGRLRQRCNWAAWSDRMPVRYVIDEGLIQWAVSLYIRTRSVDALREYCSTMPLPAGAILLEAPWPVIDQRNRARGTPERIPLAEKALASIPIIREILQIRGVPVLSGLSSAKAVRGWIDHGVRHRA